MAAAADRGPETIKKMASDLVWESMPDRIRFAPHSERRWFKHLPEGWCQRVVLVTIDGFEKQEWIEPSAERYVVRCKTVMKMMRPGSVDPDLSVPIIEKSMLFERSQDKREDGMTIFREVPT